MKITVINGSPRTSRGYTSQILEPFIKGMQNAGAEISLIYSHKLKIKPCVGDFYCWFKKPGECIFKDDMQVVYNQLKDTDILIIATPVYIPLPGNMQNLINRLLPLMEPILENKNGRTRARFHDNIKIKKIMLIATSGWWELGNFNVVKLIVEEISANFNVEFVDCILRPNSSVMDNKPEDKKLIINTLVEAGYQFIKEGKISNNKLELISKPLMPFEDYIKEETNSYLSVKKSKN
jgi:putative NADPH-quinone reductase